MVQAKLVVVGGDARPTEVTLSFPTVIGRGRDVTLTLPHRLVSRRHCEIYLDDQGRVCVRDLGSLNGTYVNDKRIEQDHPLEPNQLLTIGNVTFRAVYLPSDDTEAARAALQETVPESLPVESAAETCAAFDGQAPIDFSAVDSGPLVERQPANERETDKAVGQETSSAAPAARRSSSQSTTPGPRAGSNGQSNEGDRPMSVRAVSGDRVEGAPASAEPADSPSLEIREGEVLASDELNLQGDFLEPNKSVSLSAIEHLPASRPELSFAGGIQTEDEVRSANPSASEVWVDVGENPEDAVRADESALQEFLRKKPR